jgi:EmrB/QacA subfamily drug resistance transporter
MESGTTTPVTGPSDRRRWWTLVVVCLGMFMVTLDSSIVNVALPHIQRDLHFTQSGLAWVVDAFLITFGSFLLLAGRLGDLVGRKKIFLGGVALFTLSSLVCGVAVDQAMLIAGRFVQGIGGAFAASAILAIIVTEFPVARDRTRAMSAYMFVAVGGGSIGLLVGGVLTQALNWHWIFFINLPIGVGTLLAGRVLIDENVGLGLRNGVDVAGSALVTVSLMVGIYAIIGVTSYGWGSAHTLGFLGVALALGVGFVVLEMRLSDPIMPLRIFRIPSLVQANVVRALAMMGMFATFFLGALYLEDVLGYTPLLTGLAFLPISATMGVLSSGVTARLVNRFGTKPVLVPGMVCITAGLLWLTRIGVGPDYLRVFFPGCLLIGLGAGLAMMPLLSIAMVDVPTEDSGLGSGVANVSLQVSSAVGLAVLSTLASNRSKTLAAAGHSAAHALTGGYRLSFLIGGICAAVGTVIAVAVLRGTPGHDEVSDQSDEERLETMIESAIL